MDFAEYGQLVRELKKYTGSEEEGYPKIPSKAAEAYGAIDMPVPAKVPAPPKQLAFAAYYARLRSYYEQSAELLERLEPGVSTLNSIACNLAAHVKRAETLAHCASLAVGLAPQVFGDNTRAQAAKKVADYHQSGEQILTEIKEVVKKAYGLEDSIKEAKRTFDGPAKGPPNMPEDNSVVDAQNKVQKLRG